MISLKCYKIYFNAVIGIIIANKDIEARWSQKNGDDYYGYKNHIKIDGKSKLIDTYMVLDALVHFKGYGYDAYRRGWNEERVLSDN